MLSQANTDPTKYTLLFPTAITTIFPTVATPSPAEKTKISTELAVSDPANGSEDEKKNICDDHDHQTWWSKKLKCQDNGVLAVASEETAGRLVKNDGTIFALSGTINDGTPTGRRPIIW